MENLKQKVDVTLQENVVYHSHPGAPFRTKSREPRNGRSIEHILAGMTDHSSAYAFSLETVAETTVEVEGQNRQLVSQPWGTGLTFVGGTVYTQEELQAEHPELTNVLWNLAQDGPRTRAIHIDGHWLSVGENDTHVPARSQGRTAPAPSSQP